MCGFVGVADGKGIVDPGAVSVAALLLAHRGPDSHGLFVSRLGQVAFAHRRLSIVDLTETGRQPMSSKCGKQHVVFNGEVYNFRRLRRELENVGFTFRGLSDTEVVLNGYKYWGEEVFEHLNGPFSIALLDEDKGALLLARDRAGEKPLYYANGYKGFIFGSEIPALQSIDPGLSSFNGVALLSYLCRGYSLDDQSLVDGIFQVRPGTLIRYDLNNCNVQERAFWHVPERERSSSMQDEDKILVCLEELLSEAVGLQLQCDVPACVLLSGGVDSSLITALASRHVSQVNTFTVRFSGFAKFDETESARLIAKQFGTNHTEIEGGGIGPDALFEIVDGLDMPINDSSMLPTFLVYKAVSGVCKVALGGDGGDELFGGYKHYSRALALRQRLGSFYPIIGEGFARKLKGLVPCHRRWRNWVEMFGADPDSTVPNIREIFSRDESLELLKHRGTLELKRAHDNSWKRISSGRQTMLENFLIADFQGHFRNSILVKSDRMSMLNSVESRAPFLDTRVLNFAFSTVPQTLKATADGRKVALKRLCQKLLPADFDIHRKLGFNLPLADLIRDKDWFSMLESVFRNTEGPVERKLALSILESHRKGNNHSDQIFGLAVLLLWAKKRGIQGVKW